MKKISVPDETHKVGQNPANQKLQKDDNGRYVALILLVVSIILSLMFQFMY